MTRTTVSASQREIDRQHMARCLELAETFRGRTSPNPIVGCVIVNRAGKVIAEGAHARAGTDHAEVVALKQLGMRAKGATLYVNLEPCNHTGRTPPCAPAVREAGVARVVIGMLDPVPGHGGGAGLLRRAGIAITTGVLRAQCERANLAWITLVRDGRAAFTCKAAMTLDGKIATVAGHSKWITGAAARADGHVLRDQHDAILVGIGTVLADDPQLSARLIKHARDPIRVVVDSKLRTPTDAKLLPRTKRKAPRTIIACAPSAPVARERALVAQGAEVWRMATHENGQLDLRALAIRLGAEGIASVLVEGGGQVHAYLLEHRLADQLVLYIAPKIVGGPAPSWVGGKGRADMGAALQVVIDERIEQFGPDMRLTGVLAPRPDAPAWTPAEEEP